MGKRWPAEIETVVSLKSGLQKSGQNFTPQFCVGTKTLLVLYEASSEFKDFLFLLYFYFVFLHFVFIYFSPFVVFDTDFEML